MSGAQGKAGVITGCIAIIAEVDERAIKKRHSQGWVMEVERDLDKLLARAKLAKRNKESVSIAYHGNIVALWERLVRDAEEHPNEPSLVELGSDQTSCHNPFNGGYYPVDLSFEEANAMMVQDPAKFKYVLHIHAQKNHP